MGSVRVLRGAWFGAGRAGRSVWLLSGPGLARSFPSRNISNIHVLVHRWLNPAICTAQVFCDGPRQIILLSLADRSFQFWALGPEILGFLYALRLKLGLLQWPKPSPATRSPAVQDTT